MNKAMKMIIAAGAAALLLAGCGSQIQQKLGTLREQTFAVTDSFENIRIESAVSDVRLLPSADGDCRVVCKGEENQKYTVTVNNGTLQVKEATPSKWTDSISLGKLTSSIEVYLPNSQYEDLTVKGDACDIDVIKDFTFHDVTLETDAGEAACRGQVTGDLKVSTDAGRILVTGCSPVNALLETDAGSITAQTLLVQKDLQVTSDLGAVSLYDVRCENADLEVDAGSIKLENLLASATAEMESSLGNITFTACDAPDIRIETSAGDIKGTLLSPKVFTVKSDLGDVDVPDSQGNQICRVTNNTGDIKITIEEAVYE